MDNTMTTKTAKFYLMRNLVNRVTINGRTYTKDDFEAKIGRNDICLCGSGKKYKKCCMK